jgi:plasmid stabilization system protein ParE
VTFSVRWKRSARNDLTKFWLQTDSALRSSITKSSHQIDQRLRADPHNEGESRPNGRRVFIMPPLGVKYRVEADGKTISVLRVWLIRRRAP